MHRLEAVARDHPARIALRCSAGQCDYATLLRRADGVAAALRGLGVGVGDAVGVQVPRSIDAVVAVLGVLRAGGAYVPVDPAYPAERRRFILEDAGVRALLVCGVSAPAAADVPVVDVAALGEAAPGPARAEAPEAPLNILYTSGSTGRPKGVVGSRGAMLNRLEWAWSALPFEAGEAVAHRSSLNFVDAGPEIFSGLLRGVPTVVVLPEEHASLASLVRALRAGAASRVTVVPSLLAALLRGVSEVGRALVGVRTWVTSGEVLSLPLYQQFRAVFPEATLVNLYGTTEVTGDVTAAVFAPGERLAETPPIGRAIAGARLSVLDERGDEVPDGQAGELYVGGPVLALGYHRRPHEENARFVDHPRRPDERVFRTGDRVRRRPDAQLDYLGRADAMVKLRGIRVDLEEIERSLLPRCPDLTDLAAVVVEQRVVAVVSAASGATTPPAEQVAAAARALPAVMRPERVVVLETFPRLSNGKRDRQALARMARAVARELTPEALPRGETEARLAAVWAAVLRRPDIARDDRFLDLGGDSLALAELMAKMEDVFELDPAVLVGMPEATLAETAARLDGHARTTTTATTVRGALSLSALGADAARDPEVLRLLVESSRDVWVLANTELPPRLDATQAAAWCEAQDGVVIRLDGAPVGVGVVRVPVDVGVGVEAPPGGVQLEEWLHAAWRGAGILSAERVWTLLARWLARRFDAEVSVVWEDHLAMLAVLKARGYRRLGRSYWTHLGGGGSDGWCEVWSYDLRPQRAAAERDRGG